MDNEIKYWPFPISKPEAEWNDHDLVEFMQIAFNEGYRPRHGPLSAIEADSPSGRGALLVFRGCRNG